MLFQNPALPQESRRDLRVVARTLGSQTVVGRVPAFQRESDFSVRGVGHAWGPRVDCLRPAEQVC